MRSRIRAVLAIAGIGFAAVLAFAGEPVADSERWFGPAPFDEEGRYTNPVGELLRGGISVRLPFFLRRIPILLSPRPEEALRAAADLRAKTAVAIHFGTFDLTDEPLDEPPERFLSAAAAKSYTELDAWVLGIGETRRF